MGYFGGSGPLHEPNQNLHLVQLVYLLFINYFWMSICLRIRHLSLFLSHCPLQSSELNLSPLILSINSIQLHLHLHLHMHWVTGNGIREHTIGPYRIRFWGFSRNAHRLFRLHISPAERCEGESANLHFRFIYINHILFCIYY